MHACVGASRAVQRAMLRAAPAGAGAQPPAAARSPPLCPLGPPVQQRLHPSPALATVCCTNQAIHHPIPQTRASSAHLPSSASTRRCTASSCARHSSNSCTSSLWSSCRVGWLAQCTRDWLGTRRRCCAGSSRGWLGGGSLGRAGATSKQMAGCQWAVSHGSKAATPAAAGGKAAAPPAAGGKAATPAAAGGQPAHRGERREGGASAVGRGQRRQARPPLPLGHLLRQVGGVPAAGGGWRLRGGGGSEGAALRGCHSSPAAQGDNVWCRPWHRQACPAAAGVRPLTRPTGRRPVPPLPGPGRSPAQR